MRYIINDATDKGSVKNECKYHPLVLNNNNITVLVRRFSPQYNIYIKAMPYNNIKEIIQYTGTATITSLTPQKETLSLSLLESLLLFSEHIAHA